MSDERNPGEHYRREALRLYGMAEAANHSAAVRDELFRMARMYEALSLQAEASQRRGMRASEDRPREAAANDTPSEARTG